MTLRRRTSHFLAWLFLVCFFAALVGAVYTVWKDRALAAVLATCAFIAGAALATSFGEGALAGAVLGAVLTVLALGAAALALAGLPPVVAFISGAFAVALLLAVTIEGETRDYVGRFFCPRCGSSVFARSADEIEVNLGTLDAPDQLTPTYELWIVRRESWLPPFPLTRRYDRDRPATSRLEE